MRRDACRELLQARTVAEVELLEAAQLIEPFGERAVSEMEELMPQSVQVQFRPQKQGQ